MVLSQPAPRLEDKHTDSVQASTLKAEHLAPTPPHTATPGSESAPGASPATKSTAEAPIRSLTDAMMMASTSTASTSVDNHHAELPCVHVPWLSDGGAGQRVSSPELETDVSRTSSTSTKKSVQSMRSMTSSASLESNQSVHTAHSSSETLPDASDLLTFKSLPERPSDTSIDVPTPTARMRVKRLHALIELAETEANYVKDLDVLVNVFFKLLPSVPFFAEAPARVDTVVRNGSDLLSLHRDLSARLHTILREKRLLPDKVRTEMECALSLGNDEAVAAFAQAFIEYAPRFQAYCEFCSKHKEAMALIDVVEQRPEWDVYQNRASDAVRHLGPSGSSASHMRSRQRLLFRDFFIKPIQRVCLYPILLQTVHRHSPAAQVDVAVLDEAIACMRRITSDVNDASAQRQSRLLTDKIIERMVPTMELSSSFLPSLGSCLMTGNLDVLYHHTTYAPLTWPLAIKYYGCVLYADFVMMFKVRKTHTYEPRYWFPLAEVKLTPGDERSVTLPHSFRLSVRGHHFEMIALNEKEHDLWRDAFAKAIANGPSLTRRVHGMDVPFPCNLPGTQQVGLSASTSLSDLAARGTTSPPPEEETDPLARYLGMCSLDGDTSRANSALGSAPAEILLRHKSPPRRAAKDRGMVFSDACISARSSFDGDWARSHGAVKNSRVGLHRLSGSETLSLRIPTAQPACDSSLDSATLNRTDSVESFTARSRRGSMADGASTPFISSPAELESGAGSATPSQPQSRLGRTLHGCMSPTPMPTSAPVEAEELSHALMEAFSPTPPPSRLKRSSSFGWSMTTRLGLTPSASTTQIAPNSHVRRGRCSSMDARVSSSSSSSREGQTPQQSARRSSSPQAAPSLSPRRRLAQRFLQRHRFSTID